MIYTFDSDEAVKYGVKEAIMIQNFRFWIAKNKANEKHYYDGRYWTYNTLDALASLFPFWTNNQIRRTLESLIEQKILIKGNYNKTPYDRTNWYAFVDEEAFLSNPFGKTAKSNGQNCQIKRAELPNQTGEKAGPIPDILPDILPGTPPISPPKGGDRSATEKLRSKKSPKASKEKTDTENAAVKDFLARYCESFKALYGQYPIITPKDAGIAKRLVKIPNIDELMERFFASKDKFITQNRHSLNIVESQLNKLAAPELKYRGAREWLAEKMAAQEQQEATDTDVPSIGTPQFPVT